MVHRGQLLPGVEDFLACRNRPPHTTRTGEVLSRLSVEDAASAGWINLALNGLDLLGDIKVSAIEVGDDRSEERRVGKECRTQLVAEHKKKKDSNRVKEEDV